MKRATIFAPVLLIAVLATAGCSLLGGDRATVAGTFEGYYFSILDDVLVTFTRDGVSFGMSVPVVDLSSAEQRGSFLAANLPAGEYRVDIVFSAVSINTANPDGTTYSMDGGSFVPADSDTVSGDGPYTHTIVIDSLPLDSDTGLHIYFGDVE